MDKAIVELQKYKNILLNEAAVGGYKFALGYIQARKDILTKLERGGKEQ